MSPNSTFASFQRTQPSNPEQFSRSEIFALHPLISNLISMLLTSLGSVFKTRTFKNKKTRPLLVVMCPSRNSIQLLFKTLKSEFPRKHLGWAHVQWPR